jgi:hypothetical protein
VAVIATSGYRTLLASIGIRCFTERRRSGGCDLGAFLPEHAADENKEQWDEEDRKSVV